MVEKRVAWIVPRPRDVKGDYAEMIPSPERRGRPPARSRHPSRQGDDAVESLPSVPRHQGRKVEHLAGSARRTPLPSARFDLHAGPTDRRPAVQFGLDVHQGEILLRSALAACRTYACVPGVCRRSDVLSHWRNNAMKRFQGRIPLINTFGKASLHPVDGTPRTSYRIYWISLELLAKPQQQAGEMRSLL